MVLKRETSMTDFPKLMNTFYAEAGLDPLTSDANGRYIIELNDDDRPIFCFKNSDWMGTVYASVVTIQPNSAKDSELIMALLSGFTGILKSRPDVLCFDQQNNDIVLFRRFSFKIHLYAIIEDFANSLCAFRELAASNAIAGPATMPGRMSKSRITPSAIRA